MSEIKRNALIYSSFNDLFTNIRAIFFFLRESFGSILIFRSLFKHYNLVSISFSFGKIDERGIQIRVRASGVESCIRAWTSSTWHVIWRIIVYFFSRSQKFISRYAKLYLASLPRILEISPKGGERSRKERERKQPLQTLLCAKYQISSSYKLLVNRDRRGNRVTQISAR